MKRKGFTLVELLIVIVIIGILAGAMMMLMGSSSDKAEATKIISDLRTMKGGVLQYYADHSEYPATAGGTNITTLESYVDKELDTATYDLQNSGGTVYVGKVVPTDGAGDKFRDAVANDDLRAWFLTSKGVPDSGDLIESDSDINATNWVYQQAN
jgi:general secretion pathway protein G